MLNMDRKRSMFYSIRDRSYGFPRKANIRGSGLGSEYLVKRLNIEKKFVGHEGCVNTVAWNESGDMLLSGSDDCQLNIYRMGSVKPAHSIPSGHRANIFSAKFLPSTGDTKIVSCSGDGVLHYNDINSWSYYGKSPFHCHAGTTYEVNTTPAEPHTFLSSGEDGTVRLFDLRYKTKCRCDGCRDDVLIDCGDKAVTSFSVNPVFPYYIAVGCEDSMLRVYDRRSLSTERISEGGSPTGLLYQIKPKTLQQRNCRVTSLNYSSDGRNLLASFCSDYVYLFDSNPALSDPVKPNDLPDGEPNGMCSDPGNDLPVKRLRLRGDWSDTGPNARPESEESGSGDSGFIQRMSGYLTRWIQESIQSNRRSRRRDTSDSQSDSEDVTERSIRRDENPNNTDAFDETEGASDVVQETGNSPDVDANRDSNVSHGTCEGQERTSEDPIDDRQRDLGDQEGILGSGQGMLKNQERILGGFEGPSGSRERTMEGLDGDLEDPRTNRKNDVKFSEDQKRTLGDQGGTSKDHKRTIEDQKELLQDDVGTSGNYEETSEDHERTCGAKKMKTGDTPPLVNSDRGQSSGDQDSEHSTGTRTSDETLPPRSRDAEVGGRSGTGDGDARRNAAASVIQNYFRFRHRNNSTARQNNIPVYSAAKQIYKGHRNARTMIKEANFWGDDFVLSGSDCGRVFIWSRHTGALVMLLQGDTHVVNCVQPHPFDPILATSGIDYDVKLWTPTASNVCEMEDAQEVVSRNEKMLREGRDTLTVPASFMIRFLSSLHRVRVHTVATNQSPTASDSDDDD